MKYPKLSICIPTYNRADLIGVTLSCVVHQTVKPDEVIVIDNASNDNTKEVVKRFANYGIHYVRNTKNIGMAGNYNSCIELASYEYFTFLPSDDLIAPTWCEEWKRVIKKHTADLYTSPIVVVDNTYTPYWVFPLFKSSRLIKQPYVLKTFNNQFTPGLPPSAASIYTKQIFKHIDPFDPEEGSECDVRPSTRLLDLCNVYYYNRVLFAFREHDLRSFDEKKEIRSDKRLCKTDRYFAIVSDIYSKRYGSDREKRHMIQVHALMTVCTYNLYLVRLQFRLVVGGYKLLWKYFPDMFLYTSDWTSFVKIQWELIRRAVSTKNIPRAFSPSLKWLTKLPAFQ